MRLTTHSASADSSFQPACRWERSGLGDPGRSAHPAEHETVLCRFLLALEARVPTRLRCDLALDAGAREPLEAPAPGRLAPRGVLHHDIDPPPRPFRDHAVLFASFE